MKLITRQNLASNAAKKWLGQYPETRYKGTDKWDIYENLVFLGDSPSIEQVNATIGNESWTRISCDNCSSDVDSAVLLTVFDSDFWICKDCLNIASNLINENP